MTEEQEQKHGGEWRARALIDRGALRDNLKVARRLAPNSRVMAVVKADAYGHGLAEVTETLAPHVDAFAVATLEEALACRDAHPRIMITVLSGLLAPESLEVCARHDLQPLAHSSAHLEWLARYDGAPLSVWLKIDTGMTRLGLEPARVAGALGELNRNSRIRVSGLMSHLANADDAEDDFTASQLERYRKCADQHELARSLANSAGIMQWPQTHLDWVRPGILLYGGSPLRGRDAGELGLRAAMQLEARLISVRDIEAGRALGYGGAYRARAAARIGMLAFGYADGYPRQLSDRAAALVGGARAPVVGRVSMDMLALDLSDCPPEAAVVGGAAVLWGEELRVDEIAEHAGTVAHELLCGVGSRVPRIFVERING
ncbi:MAG: alanine racemase [Gammaproteobacteria bacterium]|nr:alanine racemase [Gammaproteobacteria bacterium]MDA8022867.1 alanine racemase [Gammaproteobacteria bacterium]